jgi:1-phosphofructokinase
MVAGIIAAYLRALPLAECARLATAFSMDALTRLESGITSPAAIDQLMNQVAIEEG